MKILFITSTRLGDGVISTSALRHFVEAYPGADVTVACGPLLAGIFAQAPGVSRVISIKKEPYSMHWWKLWKQTAGTPWDVVIDLRNSIVSRLVFAKKKYIWGKADERLHKVEQIAEVIDITPPPAPLLWFNEATLQKARTLVPAGTPVLAIGPAANWLPKTWPAENFIELINKLTAPDGILPNARVAVFAAPGEEEPAYKVLNAVPAERRIDVIAKASPDVVAATIKQCAMYIGNDSGLMHSASAVGVPTLGLFGPSWPHLYSPWGAHAAYVSTPENFTELTSYDGYDAATAPSLMRSLTVTAAYAAAVELWNRVKK